FLGGLYYEAMTQIGLAQGKVAGTRVQDQLYALLHVALSRAVGSPGILAYFESEFHAFLFVHKIADRVALPFHLKLFHYIGWPWCEPARLVMDAVSGQELLGCKAYNLFVFDDTGRIKNICSDD